MPSEYLRFFLPDDEVEWLLEAGFSYIGSGCSAIALGLDHVPVVCRVERDDVEEVYLQGWRSFITAHRAHTDSR
jgi:hypothetical protein